MKTFNKSILSMFALATVVMASCSDNDTWNEENGPDPSKELISFSSQDGQIGTRAVFEGTRAGLHSSNNTKIVMRIKAEINNELTGYPTPTTDKDKTRYTRTVAVASTEKSDDEHSVLNETHSDVSFPSNSPHYYRYWDDAWGRFSKLSVFAVAIPGYTTSDVLSDNVLAGIDGCSGPNENVNNKTDDATKVSDINTKWFTETENEKCEWEVPTTEQTDETNAKKDLCYSNNIQVNGKKGVYQYSWDVNNKWVLTDNKVHDGQLQWRPKDTGSTIGKFDEGNMVFKHALCKVTIELTEGTGFNNSSTEDFNFKTNTNVELLNFPYKGKLNLLDGSWSDISNSKISKLQETTNVDENNKPTQQKTVRTVTGLTLPGKNLYEDTKNSLHFNIDDNDYYITGKTIAEAIRNYYTNTEVKPEYQNFSVMKEGHHYLIKINVNKSEIKNVTAQLIDWEKVQSTPINPSNAYIQISLKGNSNSEATITDGSKFNIYRKSSQYSGEEPEYDNYETAYNKFEDYQWDKGYEGPAPSKTYKNNVWDTGWNWPNNKTYYHLRITGDNGDNPSLPTLDTSSDTKYDYFTIYGDALSGTSLTESDPSKQTNYHDYIWGAPFTETASNYVYTADNGFDQQITLSGGGTTKQIYKAIGATKDEIKMMLFHMTAQVSFNITTTTGDNKVTLRSGTKGSYNETKVEILRFYQQGKVYMGTGKVEATNSTTNAQQISFSQYTDEKDSKGAISSHTFGVVPQTLNRETATEKGNEYKVGLRITTPDGNQYVIEDISTVYASAVTDNNIKNPYTPETSGSDTKYKIDRWYPGYKYIYNIRITKKGIDKITAQLLDWEKVTSDNIDINLEGK